MTTVLSTEPSTLPELLRMRALELGDSPLLAGMGVEESYGEFAHRVSEAAAGLRELGVGPGDVVGVVLRNAPEYLEIWWAILWLGAVFNPINPDLTAREAVQILSDSGAMTVVCDGQMSAAVEAHREQLPRLAQVVTVELADGDPLAALRGAGTVPLAEAIAPDDLAALVYTSGTTGRPKGAMLTHGNFLADAWMLAELLPIGRGDVLGMVLPLFHVNAQVVTTTRPAADRWADRDVGAFLGLELLGDRPAVPAGDVLGRPDDARGAAPCPRCRRGRDEHPPVRDLRRGTAVAGTVPPLREEVRRSRFSRATG